MHDTAYKIGGLVMATYLPPRACRILEIGSMNVNGGLRDHAPRNADYIGLDLEEGPGVDHVVTGIDDWPVANDSFDLVLASSAFEHDPAFWSTFLEMCKKTRPGGYIYVGAPANGKVHRYPKDYWRFYPDAGLALQDWALKHNVDIMLVESFTAEREHDVWNDFCAVFRRGPSEHEIVVDFVHHKVPCTNALSWRTHELIQPIEFPEDMRLLEAIADQRLRWEHHAAHITHEAGIREAAIRSETDQANRAAEGAATDRDHHAKHIEILQSELGDLRQKREEWNHALSDTQNRNEQLEHELATLQSRLAQREEEVAQAWQAAHASDARQQELIDASDRSAAQVEEQRGWVLNLALARTMLERKLIDVERKLEKMQREHEGLQLKLDREVRVSASLRHEIDHMARTERPEDTQPALQEAANRIAALEATILQSLTASADSADDARRLQEAIDRLGARNEESVNDLAALSDMVADLQDDVAETSQQNSWLREVARVLLEERKPWLALLPGSKARQRRDRLLLRRGLFDAEAYSSRYPDVINDGQDPLRHFIVHGIAENRKID